MKSRAIGSGVVLLAAGLCLSSGCTPSNDPGAATDTSKPLGGSAPTKPTQLVGTWFATTEGDFVGIEFMKDGKALVSHGPGGGLTIDYSVLEGGRLSLIMAGGATQVYDTTLAGDLMDLKGSASLLSSGGTQRFRKLKAGQTIDDAMKEDREAKAKAYQERVAALDSFLKQPGLVLAFTNTGAGAPPSIALDIQPAGGTFNGKAWHDDRPPHLNHISGQLSLNEKANAAQVSVTYGPRIAPPAAQQDGGGQITMNVTGDAKDLRIAANVTFGGGPAHELVLRSDPKLHAEIVKRYDAELARIESLKQPLIKLLKDHAVLRGQLGPMDARQTQPDTADLVLARDKNGLYHCEGVVIAGLRGRGELVSQGGAVIVISNDKASLRIVCPPSREITLELPDEKAPRLAGHWAYPGQGQGKGAQFEVVEALDAAARDARFEAQRKALKALGADAHFTGLAFEDSGLGLEMPVSFRLQITVAPAGSVTGKADYPSMSTLMTVAGQVADTPRGPRLQLNYTAAEATPGDQIFLRSIQRGTWSLAPESGSGPMKLTGYFTGPPLRTTTLTQVSDESKSQMRKKVVEALKGGGQFHLARCTGWQVPGQTPTVVEWKLDEATGKVTGRIITGGRPLGAYEKAANTYEGDLKDQNGWTIVNLVQVSQLKPNDKFVTAFELMASEDSNGSLYLSGQPTGIGRVVNEKRVSEAPPGKGYPVAFIPVAATDAATRAAINKAIADVEKATADATAAVKAQETAALDARRARMAPFFPLFQSSTGSVITTDTGVEMGSVILESQVDEAKATIAGKGVDLRVMPLRDFTFETDLDRSGNLVVTTSVSKTPYAFNAATEKGATGRGVALTALSAADRGRIDALIQLGKRLQGAPQAVLTVETLDAAAAKAREPGLAAINMPGVAIYKERKNDQVAGMFTAKSNGRFRWAKEPVALRLNEPMKGKALYFKSGGPTDNLTVVINGKHRAAIPAIAQLGAAAIALPADLEILDIRLEAGGTAQARAVVLLK